MQPGSGCADGRHGNESRVWPADAPSWQLPRSALAEEAASHTKPGSAPNWLFAGSERGGRAAATIYSIIESCKRVDVDPFEDFREVLVRVATHPAERVDELAPDRWKVRFAAKTAS